MIDTARSTDSQSAATPEAPVAFHIERAWYDARNLSFDDVVRSRVCDACRAQMGQERDERVPVFDKTTGKMQIESRRTVLGSDPIRMIREHCGRAKGYITHDMPSLEAIFRILLANGNTPMTMEEVREQLVEWCPGGGCQWLLLPLDLVVRLVRNDRFYGIQTADIPR